MKKHLIAVTLASVLSTQAFVANASSTEQKKQEKQNELVGLGSGAVVGAIVAGPVGAAVAAIFGLMIADDVNDENKLKLADADLDKKERQLVVLQNEYKQARQQAEMQLVSLDTQIERVTQELETSVQFRTGSYVIEPHFRQQLDLVAEGLNKNSDQQVSLSGFADQRGDSSFNQALSEQRALNVKNYLLKEGVNPSQINTYSFGEAQPLTAEQGLEDNFFDRRVVLRLSAKDKVMTASAER